jgi:RNA polymerase-binding transcription factor DksA
LLNLTPKGGAVNNTPIVKRCEENLQKRRHEILPVLQHLAAESRSGNVWPASRPDDAASTAFVTSRLAAVYERELNDIDTALSRIRTGTFGYCRACHQAIEPSRLERFPRAEFCLRCKDV